MFGSLKIKREEGGGRHIIFSDGGGQGYKRDPTQQQEPQTTPQKTLQPLLQQHSPNNIPTTGADTGQRYFDRRRRKS